MLDREMRILFAALVIVVLSGSAFSNQSRIEEPTPVLTEFEVATVKPSNPDVFDVVSHVPDLDIRPGHILEIVNITLKDI